MVFSGDFRLQSIQATAFVSTDELRPSAALRFALVHWGELYAATPITLPIPFGLSPDIPEVTLLSDDQTQRLEIARGRVNFYWQGIQGSQIVDIGPTFSEFAERIFTLFQDQGARIGRLAAVVVRVGDVSNPGITLARQYFRDEWLQSPFNRPEGLEIHAHKVYPLLPSVSVNSWMRIRTAGLTNDGYNSISVEQDLNSLESERKFRDFSVKEVRDFYETVSGELDSILTLYFPYTEAKGKREA